MSVQELKQLTNLRLSASHQPEVNSIVNKAVLSNVAKSHFRETLGQATESSSVVQKAAAASAMRKLSISAIDSPDVPVQTLSPRAAQLHKVAGLFRDGNLSGTEKARAKDIIIQESMQALRDIGNFEEPVEHDTAWQSPANKNTVFTATVSGNWKCKIFFVLTLSISPNSQQHFITRARMNRLTMSKTRWLHRHPDSRVDHP